MLKGPLPVFLVNDKNCTKIVNTGVIKTRPSQQKKQIFFSGAIQVFFRNNIYFMF
jgi:hypothetical protein